MCILTWCQNYSVSDSMMYNRQGSLLSKHNTAESMVGILPLAPHHDLLQYIHHVHFNANAVKTRALQSLPLGITPSSVFQYIGIHIQFTHPKFQNFADLSHVQLFTWTFKTKPLGFHELLLLVLSFRLIPKSRNVSASWAFLQDFLGSWQLFEVDFQPSSAAFGLLPWSMCTLDFTFLTC